MKLFGQQTRAELCQRTVAEVSGAYIGRATDPLKMKIKVRTKEGARKLQVTNQLIQNQARGQEKISGGTKGRGPEGVSGGPYRGRRRKF